MLKRKGGDRSEIETWRAFLSGVCTVAVAMPPTPLIVAKVKAACLELGGGEVSGESVTRAAAFLLGELKLLESAEVGGVKGRGKQNEGGRWGWVWGHKGEKER